MQGCSLQAQFTTKVLHEIVKNVSKKFGWELACEPKTTIKREFLEVSRRVSFWNILIHVTEFSPELQNTKISSVTLLNCYYTTDVLPAVSKILGALTEFNFGGVRFFVLL